MLRRCSTPCWLVARPDLPDTRTAARALGPASGGSCCPGLAVAADACGGVWHDALPWALVPAGLPALVDRRPVVTPSRLIAELVPPPRFDAVRFASYHPD